MKSSQSKKILLGSLIALISFEIYRQNRVLAAISGGVFRISNERDYSIVISMANALQVAVLSGVLLIIIGIYREVKMLKLVVFVIVLFTSLVLVYYSYLHRNTDTMDIIFGNKPYLRMLLNSCLLIWAASEINKIVRRV